MEYPRCLRNILSPGGIIKFPFFIFGISLGFRYFIYRVVLRGLLFFIFYLAALGIEILSWNPLSERRSRSGDTIIDIDFGAKFAELRK